MGKGRAKVTTHRISEIAVAVGENVTCTALESEMGLNEQADVANKLSSEQIARASGWLEQNGQIFRLIQGATGNEPNAEYANDWQDAAAISQEQTDAKLVDYDLAQDKWRALGSEELVHRIEAAGFSVSGPTDIRAAEHGEPVWVCNAREALSEKRVGDILDVEEKPQLIDGAVKSGEHRGHILRIDGNAVIQSAGRGKTVTHDATKLSGLPKEGESATIKYNKEGRGTVTLPNEESQAKDRGR